MASASAQTSTATPIAVYVHIPYCVTKCPYCDFNSYAVGLADEHDNIPEEEYTSALLEEISFRSSQEAWENRKIGTIFFGGGTPSLFQASSLQKILSHLDSKLGITSDAEITLEANPGTIQEKLGLDKMKGFRAAGINRVSMGVQSFRQEKLSFLGRLHSAEDAEKAVSNITTAGFDNFNLDLIYGVANETADEWSHDLARALALGSPHISAYGLTIESGTEFGRRAKKGTLPLAEDSLQADLQMLTYETLKDKGFTRYEISNFAKDNLECRHNLCYWQGVDYLGLGAGAHSFLKSAPHTTNTIAYRWSNIPKPEHYIARASTGGDASQLREEIALSQFELEFFFTRIRMTKGISLEEYERIFQRSFLESYSNTIAKLEQEELLLFSESSMALSPKGFLFADYVLDKLASHAPEFQDS